MAVSSTAMTRLGWVCDQFLNRLSFPGQPCACGERVGVRSNSLKEDADVLGRQYVLVEDDFAARDLPRAVDPTQHILPGPDIKILFELRPAAIDNKIGIGPELGLRVAGLRLDIRNQVAGARWRVLRPSHAGVEPYHARIERRPVLVEDRELVLLGDVVLDIAGGIEDRD